MVLLPFSRCGTIRGLRFREVEANSSPEEIKRNKKFDVSSCFTSLTVWRKSLVFSCYGFQVFDSLGNLVYRVEHYRGDHTEDIVLMDAYGKPILTLQRKKRRFVENWAVFEGEGEAEERRDGKPKKPIYWGRKKVNLLLQRNPNVLAHVFRGSDSPEKGYALVIHGSYERRSCQVVDDETREVVAEIKTKDDSVQGISFGLDVFLLIVRPGFNPAFAMSLVLLLDQMFS